MRGFVGALLPVQCAGCRAWDEVLCPSCRSLAGGPAHVASLEGVRGPLPLVAMGDYDGPLRRIVLAAKHSARTDVTDFLDEAGARLGASLASVLGVAGSPAAAVGSLEGRVTPTGSADRERGGRVGGARALVVEEALAGQAGGAAAGARCCPGVGGRCAAGCARARGGRGTAACGCDLPVG